MTVYSFALIKVSAVDPLSIGVATKVWLYGAGAAKERDIESWAMLGHELS